MKTERIIGLNDKTIIDYVHKKTKTLENLK